MSASRPLSRTTAALALRLHFLLEALRLDLLPPPLARAVSDLASRAEADAERVRSAASVACAFAQAHDLLRLSDLPWPEVPERLVPLAAREALSRAVGDPHPRAAAERLGRTCEDLIASDGRRRTGSYYTPRWAADAVAQTVLSGLLKARSLPPEAALSLRVLDPAVGAGAFALAMMEALAGAAGEGEDDNAARRRVLQDCLWLAEKDPLVAEACRLSLWLAASRPGRPASPPAARVTVGDALAHPPEPRAFDLVVGNPPWGVKLAPRRAKTLARAAPEALSGHRDSALFFLQLAADSARDDAALGLLLPDALLWQVRYEGARASLLERFRPLSITLLGNNTFPGATAPSALLCLIGARVGPKRFSIGDFRAVPRADLASHVTSSGRPEWCASTKDPLTVAHHSLLIPPPWLQSLLQRLASEHPTLGEMDTFRFHDVGINYPRAALGRAVLYPGSHPKDPRDIPVTRGRDFGPLTSIGHSAFLHHDWRDRIPPRSGVAVRSDVYAVAPKLLLRQTADRPIATVDRRGVYFGRSVIALTAPRESDLLWLAAVLNSHTFAALYRALAPELGRTFAQVKVSKLRLVPVPAPARDAGSPLPDLTRALLDAGNETDRHALWSELEREVARLYALSGREMRHISVGLQPSMSARGATPAPPAGTW